VETTEQQTMAAFGRRSKSVGAGLVCGLQAVYRLYLWRTAPLQLRYAACCAN